MLLGGRFENPALFAGKARRAGLQLIGLQIRFQALEQRPAWNRHFYHLPRVAPAFRPGTGKDMVLRAIDFVVRSIDFALHGNEKSPICTRVQGSHFGLLKLLIKIVIDPGGLRNLALPALDHRSVGSAGDAAFSEEPHIVWIDFDPVVGGPVVRTLHGSPGVPR